MPGEMPQTPYKPPEVPINSVETPREALLEIQRLLAGPRPQMGALWEAVVAVSKEGLDRNRPPNFELTDQLADRLAEAHRLLGDLREGTVMASLREEISEVLALPPDLEAMVERRIGHG